MTITLLLHKQIESIAPIEGVSIGRANDKGTWRIDFKAEATPEQRIAAQTAIDLFDTQAAIDKEQRVFDRQKNAEQEARLAAQLRTLTPQQAVDYIENNVADLLTAKFVLKIMARMLIAMRDQIWPEMPE